MGAMLLAMAAASLAAQAQPQGGPAEPARALRELHNNFSTDDYPIEAQRRNAQGTVHFTLEIDRRGMPSRCIVDQSSSDPDLDRATCEILMTRARFSPARDARGRAVEDRVSSRVRWVLPEDGVRGLPLVQIRFVASIDVTADSVLCQLTVEGREVPGSEGRSVCGPFAGPVTEAAMRSLGPGNVLTVVTDLEPAGSPVRPAIQAWGEVIVETEARFSIGDDGSVVDCRSTRRRVHRQVGAIRSAPDMCASPLVNGRPFMTQSEAATPRFGVVRVRIYLRAERRP